MPGADATHHPSSAGPSPGLVLAGASIAQVAVSFINFGLPSVGPALRSSYGLSLPAYGAAVTATLLGNGASLIAWGALIDRFGSRRCVTVGTLIAVVSVTAAAVTTSAAILTAALFCSGLGTAVIAIAGSGALFRVYGAERRAWALGVRQMAFPLGGVAAAVALPPFEHALGVHAVLYLAAALVGTAGLAFSFVADAGSAPGNRMVGFALWRILRVRRIWTLFGISALYIMALQACLSYLVPSLRDAGLSALGAVIGFIVLNLSAAACRLFWGTVADRGGGRRRSRTLFEIGLVTTLGSLLLAGARHGGGLATVLPAVAILGFGAFGWNHLVYVSAGESVPPALAGQAVAVAATLVFAMGGLLTAPMGALADAYGWDTVWLLMAGIALLGAFASRRLKDLPPASPAAPPAPIA